MANTACILRSAALVCLLTAAYSYPSLWIGEKEATAPPVANCLAHPIKPEGAHKAPTADSTGAIEVADSAGTAVTAVCPGGEYNVTLTFPEARRVLLIATQGNFSKAEQKVCPGRSYTPKGAAAVKTYTETLTVPCNVTGKTVNVAVTSAAGKTAAFQNLGTKLTVSPLADCPTSTCPAGTANTTRNATAAANATRTAAAANASEALPAAATPGAVAAAAPAANTTGAASPAKSSAAAAQMSFGFVVLGVAVAAFGL